MLMLSHSVRIILRAVVSLALKIKLVSAGV